MRLLPLGLALAGRELDEQRAVGDRVADGAVHGLDDAVRRRRAGSAPSSSPRARRGCRPWRPSHPASTGTERTRPVIGAAMRLLRGAARPLDGERVDDREVGDPAVEQDRDRAADPGDAGEQVAAALPGAHAVRADGDRLEGRPTGRRPRPRCGAGRAGAGRARRAAPSQTSSTAGSPSPRGGSRSSGRAGSRPSAAIAANSTAGVARRADVGQRRLLAADQPGVHPPGGEVGVAAERLQEAEVGRRPRDVRAPERLAQPEQRRRPRLGGVRRDLGDHRVVVRADPVAAAHAGVDPRALREGDVQQRPRRRQEALRRVLGVDAGPRRRGRSSGISSWASGSGSPAATRSCHSTRSRPVIASVTGCSTCRRVFISMNQKPSGAQRPGAVGDELDRAGVRGSRRPAPP